jgi:hypothetical protein
MVEVVSRMVADGSCGSVWSCAYTNTDSDTNADSDTDTNTDTDTDTDTCFANGE